LPSIKKPRQFSAEGPQTNLMSDQANCKKKGSAVAEPFLHRSIHPTHHAPHSPRAFLIT
jgi:hypothetical protein